MFPLLSSYEDISITGKLDHSLFRELRGKHTIGRGVIGILMLKIKLDYGKINKTNAYILRHTDTSTRNILVYI